MKKKLLFLLIASLLAILQVSASTRPYNTDFPWGENLWEKQSQADSTISSGITIYNGDTIHFNGKVGLIRTNQSQNAQLTFQNPYDIYSDARYATLQITSNTQYSSGATDNLSKATIGDSSSSYYKTNVSLNAYQLTQKGINNFYLTYINSNYKDTLWIDLSVIYTPGDTWKIDKTHYTANDAAKGTITFSDTLAYVGESISVSANVNNDNNNYFTGWNDGSQNTIKYVYQNNDTVYVASFNTYAGKVVIKSEYFPGLTIYDENGKTPTAYYNNYDYQNPVYNVKNFLRLQINDNPNECLYFKNWSDGDTSRTRIYTPNGKVDTLSAIFEMKKPTYTIELSQEGMGYVTREYDYDTVRTSQELSSYDTTNTCYAHANPGYKFLGWTYDSVTTSNSALRVELTCMETKKYTALFAAGDSIVNIVLLSNDTTMGTVTGGGNQLMETAIKKEAIAKPGYELDYWTSLKGLSTDIATTTDTLIAYFKKSQIRVNVSCEGDSSKAYYSYLINGNRQGWKEGSVSTTFYTNAGENYYGDTLVITIVPNSNAKFVQWSDSSVENPRTFILTSDVYLSVLVSGPKDSVYICGYAADTSMGTVNGNGYYTVGDTVTLTAIAKNNAVFAYWSNQCTTNTLTLIAKEDSSFYCYEAEFAQTGEWGENLAEELPFTENPKDSLGVQTFGVINLNDLNLNVEQMNYLAVNATVDALVGQNTSAIIECYSDKNCENLLGTISIKNETSSEKANLIYSTGLKGASAEVTESFNANGKLPAGTQYLKIQKSDKDASTTTELDNALKNLSVKITRLAFTIEATANNKVMGEVEGAGQYLGGDTVKLTAKAITGYRFVKWSDNDSTANRTFTASDDRVLTAYFEPTSGIENLNAEDGNEIVDVYNAMGVMLKNQVKRTDALKGLKKGFYIVGGKKSLKTEE